MSYNEKNFPNLGHLKEALIRSHGEVSALAGLVVGTIEDMILQADIAIPVSAWVANTDTITKADGYDYIADVSVPNLIENANVNVTLSVHSLSVAGDARLSKTVIVSAGNVRFYAKSKPEAELSGKLDAIQLENLDEDVTEGLGSVNVPDGINTAERVNYNNTSSGLSADNVQEAADEICANAKIQSTDQSTAFALLLNYARQQAWEIEHGQVDLTNNQIYPANNSKRSVSLAKRESNDYIVIPEVISFKGNVGEIEISEKLTNGFKIAYTGSAQRATIKYTVIGGFLK